MPTPHRSFLRRLLEFRLLFVVNVLLLVVLTLSFGREIIRNMEIRHDIADLQSQAEELEARHLEITQLHTALQTESFIEREARLKLGLKKPGEEVVVVQQADSSEPQSDETTAAADATAADVSLDTPEQAESLANPTKWWYYFFDAARFHQLTAYVPNGTDTTARDH